jgi:hypothetical protein
MYHKNQLVVFAFLILLTLSITPLLKNSQQNKSQTSSNHPTPSSISKANTTKDAKATEVAKAAS